MKLVADFTIYIGIWGIILVAKKHPWTSMMNGVINDEAFLHFPQDIFNIILQYSDYRDVLKLRKVSSYCKRAVQLSKVVEFTMRMYGNCNPKSRAHPCIFCIENHSRCFGVPKRTIPVRTRSIGKAGCNGLTFILFSVSVIRLDFMSYSPFSLQNSLRTILSLAEISFPPRLRNVAISNIPFTLFRDFVDELDLSTVNFCATVTLIVEEGTAASFSEGFSSFKNIVHVEFVEDINIRRRIDLVKAIAKGSCS